VSLLNERVCNSRHLRCPRLNWSMTICVRNDPLDLGVSTRKQNDRGITAGGRLKYGDYFGYLNSGAAFNASLVVLIDASHLSFLLS